MDPIRTDNIEVQLPADFWRGMEARCPLCGEFRPADGAIVGLVQYFCPKCDFRFDDRMKATQPVEAWQRGLSNALRELLLDQAIEVCTAKAIVSFIETETGSRVYARLLLNR